jgi:hypothetical protein
MSRVTSDLDPDAVGLKSALDDSSEVGVEDRQIRGVTESAGEGFYLLGDVAGAVEATVDSSLDRPAEGGEESSGRQRCGGDGQV